MSYILDIHKAVISIKADCKFAVRGENKSTIQETLDACELEWHKGESPISKEDIQAKQTELQTEYDAQEYARARAVAYPSTPDFMEAYTEKEIGGDSTKWDAYVINYNKVRTENPK